MRSLRRSIGSSVILLGSAFLFAGCGGGGSDAPAPPVAGDATPAPKPPAIADEEATQLLKDLHESYLRFCTEAGEPPYDAETVVMMARGKEASLVKLIGLGVKIAYLVDLRTLEHKTVPANQFLALLANGSAGGWGLGTDGSVKTLGTAEFAAASLVQ